MDKSASGTRRLLFKSKHVGYSWAWPKILLSKLRNIFVLKKPHIKKGWHFFVRERPRVPELTNKKGWHFFWLESGHVCRSSPTHFQKLHVKANSFPGVLMAHINHAQAERNISFLSTFSLHLFSYLSSLSIYFTSLDRYYFVYLSLFIRSVLLCLSISLH